MTSRRTTRAGAFLAAGAVTLLAIVLTGPAAPAAPAQAPPSSTTTTLDMPLPMLQMTPDAGPPGTTYTMAVLCGSEQPQATVSYQFGDTVEPVTFALPATGGTWTTDRTAGDTDATYQISCDGNTTSVTFDVQNPIMVFTPPDASVFDGVAGTDCDAGSVDVELLVGFRPAVHVPVATDERGDWATPLPADAERLGVIVNATCGDLAYETLEWGTAPPGGPTTTAPGAGGPPVAAPASPVSGAAAYTG